MIVSLAEAMWRTKLASSLADMRGIAAAAGALRPDDTVDLRPFLGERTKVPLETVTVVPTG